MAEHKTSINVPWHEDAKSILIQMAKSYAILQNTIDLMLAGIRVQTHDILIACPDDDMTAEEQRLWNAVSGAALKTYQASGSTTRL
jgi:hypothetical protein